MNLYELTINYSSGRTRNIYVTDVEAIKGFFITAIRFDKEFKEISKEEAKAGIPTFNNADEFLRYRRIGLSLRSRGLTAKVWEGTFEYAEKHDAENNYVLYWQKDIPKKTQHKNTQIKCLNVGEIWVKSGQSVIDIPRPHHYPKFDKLGNELITVECKEEDY